MKYKFFLFSILMIIFSNSLFADSMFKDLSVTADDSYFLDYTYDGVELNCKIRVENSNAASVKMLNSPWKLEVDNVLYTEGLLGESKISGNSSKYFNIKIKFDFASLYKLENSFLNRETAESKLRVRVLFDVPLQENKEYDIAFKNVIYLLKKPRIHFDSLELVSMEPEQISMIFNCRFHNDNEFPVEIGDFKYTIKVNDEIWNNGISKKNLILTENSSKILSINFSIRNSTLISEICNAVICSENINFNVCGSFNVNSEFKGLEQVILPYDISSNSKISL